MIRSQITAACVSTSFPCLHVFCGAAEDRRRGSVSPYDGALLRPLARLRLVCGQTCLPLHQRPSLQDQQPLQVRHSFCWLDYWLLRKVVVILSTPDSLLVFLYQSSNFFFFSWVQKSRESLFKHTSADISPSLVAQAENCHLQHYNDDEPSETTNRLLTFICSGWFFLTVFHFKNLLGLSPTSDYEIRCRPAHGFHHVLGMTGNMSEFTRTIKRQRISGNMDTPEGGLDAMLQAAVCQVNIHRC